MATSSGEVAHCNQQNIPRLATKGAEKVFGLSTRSPWIIQTRPFKILATFKGTRWTIADVTCYLYQGHYQHLICKSERKESERHRSGPASCIPQQRPQSRVGNTGNQPLTRSHFWLGPAGNKGETLCHFPPASDFLPLRRKASKYFGFHNQLLYPAEKREAPFYKLRDNFIKREVTWWLFLGIKPLTVCVNIYNPVAWFQ